MTDYRKLSRRFAQQEGIDPNIFERQIGAESNFDPNAVSPAGAEGIAQIMPGTAAGWHVDPHDPIAALKAAAHADAQYIHRYGSFRDALIAYNAGPGAVGGSIPAETRAYISRILGGSNPVGTSTPMPGPSVSTPTQQTDPMAKLFQVLAQYRAATQPSDAPPAQGGYTNIGPTQEDFNTTWNLLDQLSKAAHPAAAAPSGSVSTPDVAGLVTGKGAFHIIGPDPGRLQKPLIAFARKVAGVYGHPLTGLDGSSHSKYTVNGNVSDHYTGHATDIPATGATLIRMGQAALIAAGMSPAEAHKQRGGLYNVGGHQVIFNTHLGGDHTTHLHISAY